MKYKILSLILILSLVLFTACSNETVDNETRVSKKNVVLNDDTKEAQEVVEGFLEALKEANLGKLDEYVLGEDSEKMGLTKEMGSDDRKNMKAFYKFIEYEYISGSIEDGRTGELIYHVKSKSLPDLLDLYEVSTGPVSIESVETVENDVTFDMYKVNGKWIVRNGAAAFAQMVSNEK